MDTKKQAPLLPDLSPPFRWILRILVLAILWFMVRGVWNGSKQVAVILQATAQPTMTLSPTPIPTLPNSIYDPIETTLLTTSEVPLTRTKAMIWLNDIEILFAGEEIIDSETEEVLVFKIFNIHSNTWRNLTYSQFDCHSFIKDLSGDLSPEPLAFNVSKLSRHISNLMTLEGTCSTSKDVEDELHFDLFFNIKLIGNVLSFEPIPPFLLFKTPSNVNYSMSSDQKQMIYTSSPNYFIKKYAWSSTSQLDFSNLKQSPNNMYGGSIEWASDGKEIIYLGKFSTKHGDRFAVYNLDLETGISEKIHTGSGANLQWVNDYQGVFFTASYRNIRAAWLRDLQTGQLQYLYKFDTNHFCKKGKYGRLAGLSPSHKYLALQNCEQFEIVQLDEY